MTGKKSDYVPRLKTHYHGRAVPALLERLELKNPMQVPRLVKVVLNIGVSEAKENIQVMDQAKEDLTVIAGQAPQVRRAKKSISNFKLRQGMPIGLRVTLRGNRMYEFLDRLVSTAIPRIRDFRGLDPRGFDGYGNYNLGLREHQVFPEVNAEKSVKARGMNISVVTTASDDRQALELLRVLGFPFKKTAKEAKEIKEAKEARDV
ncbi:MAG: 50S ribosomal protein L5 [Elusimicrobia bacterium]|nr:50S ribosomal protein L5 [Elusimicrobiota bacterium]